jgi:hypothetical protein
MHAMLPKAFEIAHQFPLHETLEAATQQRMK